MCFSQSCHDCCASSQKTAIQTFLLDETCCFKLNTYPGGGGGRLSPATENNELNSFDFSNSSTDAISIDPSRMVSLQSMDYFAVVFDLINAFQENNAFITINVCPESAPLYFALVPVDTGGGVIAFSRIQPGTCLTLNEHSVKQLILLNLSTYTEGLAKVHFRIHYDYTVNCYC